MSDLKNMLRNFYNDLSDIRHEADKLQKALDIAMEAIELGSKLNSYSDAVNTKYECNESKQKIQEILKSGKK